MHMLSLPAVSRLFQPSIVSSYNQCSLHIINSLFLWSLKTNGDEGAAWAKISLRRTEHFVQMCILYPREKKIGVDKNGTKKTLLKKSLKKQLTIANLDLQWLEGALINTVEHPLPVLTSSRTLSTYLQFFKFSKKKHVE